MSEKDILRLAFQPQTTWGHKILNSFSDEMRNSYKNGLGRELMLSITQKMELFLHIIPQLNHYAERMKNVLKNDSENVKECLAQGFGYTSIEDELRVAFMSALDAAIFECDSLCELLEKFYVEITEKVLGQRGYCLKCELKKRHIDISWRRDLRRIRNDWIHNYHGWLAFKKNGDNFEIVIEIPANVGRKNFKGRIVDILIINTIFNGVNQYFAFVQDILVAEIERIRNNSNILLEEAQVRN
ncbi:MAG: hypothetical protein KAR20_18675 [Candidatus Heimdallarchaeota archaeon]|nr:hypothetical protein [Candidatus Heimdallarchaeota archaeon]